MSIVNERWHGFFINNFSVFLQPFVDIYQQKKMMIKMVEIASQKVLQNVHAVFVSSYF